MSTTFLGFSAWGKDVTKVATVDSSIDTSLRHSSQGRMKGGREVES
ncbi:MAG: hypothetical protein WC753_02415 [Candidatus Gracilibacteria bacterium]